jgi:hypothetical protein
VGQAVAAGAEEDQQHDEADARDVADQLPPARPVGVVEAPGADVP